MMGFEPSIDLDLENCFLFAEMVSNLTAIFPNFLPSPKWSRDTLKMEGFELAATSVATSDFQNFFGGALRAPGDPPGKGKRSVLAPSLGARLAAQDPLMFTTGYAASRPPTL